MRRSLVTGLFVILLLIGISTLAFEIQQVEASGTIYIRADESVDPSTANITSLDNVTYYFTDNNYDTIVVERSNTIIDGNGYTLQGAGISLSKGIYLSGIRNVTISNMQIKGFHYGILILYSANNNTIIGNNLIGNIKEAILLAYSSNNTIASNKIANNSIGITIAYSTDNNVHSNNISDNKVIGIALTLCSLNNSVSNNEITNNQEGLRIEIESNYNYISGNEVKNNKESGINIISANNTITKNSRFKLQINGLSF